MTINEVLVVMKAVRERVSDLQRLRSEVAVKERFFGVEKSEKEPQYDVVFVDEKIAELKLFLVLADAAIKVANARISIDLDVNVEKLLEPLRHRA